MTARFRIAFVGPHVSLQDGGRPGLMRFGVPRSGGMDRKALAIANLALGNDPAAPVVEISPGGLLLECETGPVTLAVAGGGFIVEAGAQRLGSWSVFTLRAGDRLAIRRGPWGSWCYLAFAGRLQAGQWLGSAATHAASGLGGGKLVTGGRLLIDDAEHRPAREGPLPCPVWARPRHLLHAVAGPQDRFFPPEALQAFFTQPFRMTDAFDRMGTRLAGPPLVPQAALGIPSEPILRGSVQVAGDGLATVLMADHQTTGGYPKIATLLADDTDGFAQLRPQDSLRFVQITADQAVNLARSRARLMAPWFHRLADRG